MTDYPAVEKLLYTPVEAAHALGVSRSTVYVLISEGSLASLHIGTSRRVPAEALRRYVAELSAEGPDADRARRATPRAAQRREWA